MYTNTNVYVKGLMSTNVVTLNIVVARVSESDAATRRSRPITFNVPLLATRAHKEHRNTQLQRDTGVDTELFVRFCLSFAADDNSSNLARHPPRKRHPSLQICPALAGRLGFCQDVAGVPVSCKPSWCPLSTHSWSLPIFYRNLDWRSQRDSTYSPYWYEWVLDKSTIV